MKVSAKSGKNVVEAFNYLLELIEQNKDQNEEEENTIYDKNTILQINKGKMKCC